MSSDMDKLTQWTEALQKENQALRTRLSGTEATMTQMSAFGNEKPTNVAEAQISFDKELNQMYHLLSAHEIAVVDNREMWVEPTDDRLKTFSTYGVKKIMNILSMYLNKNTIMGYYDAETILWKVKDFGIELTDLFSTRYEAILYYPTPEELHDKYWKIVEREGMDITSEELYEKCLKWSEEELKCRERELPIIGWALINMVHSAYTRAFQGKERTSLGERGIRINQSADGYDSPIKPEKGGFLGFLKG